MSEEGLEGENKHKIQCPRIKEQREHYKEKKKEEVQEEAYGMLRVGSFEEIIKGDDK